MNTLHLKSDSPISHPHRLVLPGVDNGDGGVRLAVEGPVGLDGLDELPGLLVGHAAEDHVLVVQPVGLDRRDEELGAVRVRAGVGHGKEA